MLPRAAECHSSNLPLSVKIVLAERWQQSPPGNGRSCWLRDRGERAPVLSASMVPGEMPQATSWIQENRGALYAKSDSDPQVVSATAPSQACRPEFRKKICEQLLPATECNRVTPDNSARNRHACQNQDSSAA